LQPCSPRLILGLIIGNSRATLIVTILRKLG
jgi:hypothetical protein